MRKTLLILGICLLLGAGSYFAFWRKDKTALSLATSETPSAIDQTVDVLTGVGAIQKKQEVADPQLAVIRAKAMFQKLQSEEFDFSQGLCIAEDLMPDWVADVAHNPREAVDDLPQNQCRAFREGKAHHFVELDVNGEVLKIY